MIIFEEEAFEPGRTARMDQALAATDSDIRKLVRSYRAHLAEYEGNEYKALSAEVTLCHAAMAEKGLTEEQIGFIPLVLGRLMMLMAKHEVPV